MITADHNIFEAILQYLEGNATHKERILVYQWHKQCKKQLPDINRYCFGNQDALVEELKAANIFFSVTDVPAEKSKGNHSAGTDELDLNPNVFYQLFASVAEVMAREEVALMESQNELLLSFSTSIAGVRNQTELLDIINSHLRNMLDFSHTVIGTTDHDGSVSAFLVDPETVSTSHPEYQHAKGLKYIIPDGVLEKVVSSPLPVIFDLDELNEEIDLPLYLKINFESGIRQAVIVKFPREEHICGFWIILFRNKKYCSPATLHLIEGLANQISIAVANIVANEKINSQLIEIGNYKLQLEEEKIYLKEEIESNHNYAEIIGESTVMKNIYNLVAKVAPTYSTVLILGETGTGKELIARAIHNDSPRRDSLMVKVNCATLPANLIESELFGHERGSFTGATERRLGKFELANGGTLFLDEIGEMPLDLQVKLLRALQEREIERIGGKGTIKVDVRIIAATNRDLETEVAEGRFRRDLYYRLNIFPINLPALRERSEDIPLLANHFIKRLAKKAGRRIDMICQQAMQELVNYDWPGNIRELEHQMERSVLLASGSSLKHIYLPARKNNVCLPVYSDEGPIKTIDENEHDHIFKTLKYCKGRVGGEMGAADLLGVPASTLFSKMKKLGIKRDYV
ncbi:MAG: sigma 54-interacting transcriptional regulator [Bacteroidota bacterium]